MKTKGWILGWFALVLIMLAIIGSFVYKVDPYFHYHKPDTDHYFYKLNNQRSQNDGITRHFDYDAVITGTSMIENFKASEVADVFGVNAIKVPYSGAGYKEINDNLKVAFENNTNIKLIIRGLDPGKFLDSADSMRKDLGTYPTYLYDDNPFNDVKYLFNKDVIFSRAYAMAQANNAKGFKGGITSFDDYSWWMHRYEFGINAVASAGVSFKGKASKEIHLTEEEKAAIYENITQNVTSLADEHPNVDFYYFFTPYSILWYKPYVENGTIYKQLEAEKYIIELILPHENIKLFSFKGIEDIITDINHYKDTLHYAAWINSYMLHCMSENQYRLTEDNYQAYWDAECKLITDFEYSSLNALEDYANDAYAAALFNKNLTEMEPIDILREYAESAELSNAIIVPNQYENSYGIKCTGSLQREQKSDVSVEDYILDNEFIGAKIPVSLTGKHHYLVFYGKKNVDCGQPMVVVYDSEHNKVGEIAANYRNLDNEWHQYVIDLSEVEGDVTIYFNGGYIDNTGSAESEYVFSNIILY